MNILLTGGCGYIGSNTCIELLNNGYKVIIIDDLSNSKSTIIDDIIRITNRNDNIIFYKESLLNIDKINEIFNNNKIDIVIHFAGYKSVNESIKNPLLYYNNNITSTLNLLNVMNKYNCKKIIFSSSTTVYGDNIEDLVEETECNPVQPYGRTKYFIEEILKDLYISDHSWSIVILRYFNPGGGILKEKSENATNLFPTINNVIDGIKPCLYIYGNDYNTPDGTCIRDYIHMSDLVNGHIVSFSKLDKSGIYIYNLGTGKGTSVLEIANKINKYNINLKYVITKRRDGDIAKSIANVNKASKELNWCAIKSIDDIIKNVIF